MLRKALIILFFQTYFLCDDSLTVETKTFYFWQVKGYSVSSSIIHAECRCLADNKINYLQTSGEVRLASSLLQAMVIIVK